VKAHTLKPIPVGFPVDPCRTIGTMRHLPVGVWR
jgi:hypothetical protein